MDPLGPAQMKLLAGEKVGSEAAQKVVRIWHNHHYWICTPSSLSTLFCPTPFCHPPASPYLVWQWLAICWQTESLPASHNSYNVVFLFDRPGTGAVLSSGNG